jgi:hypothetical protein
MAKKTLKTHNNNSQVWIFTWVKYPIQRFTYDRFVTHRYAYMVKVIQANNWNSKWKNAIDEKMVTLDTNANWEVLFLPKDKKNWVQMVVQGQT